MLQASAGDVETAIQQLSSAAIEKIQVELNVSCEDAASLFDRFRWDVEAARRDLIDKKELVSRLEKERQKKIAAWLAKSPRDRANKILKNVRDDYDLHNTGIVNGSGGLWELETERWRGLSDADRILDSLYTAVLLVETDHAQHFWELPAKERDVIIADIAGARWTHVSSGITKALNETDDPIESECLFLDMNIQLKPRELIAWVISNCARLSFFRDPANAPY